MRKPSRSKASKRMLKQNERKAKKRIALRVKHLARRRTQIEFSKSQSERKSALRSLEQAASKL